MLSEKYYEELKKYEALINRKMRSIQILQWCL